MKKSAFLSLCVILFSSAILGIPGPEEFISFGTGQIPYSPVVGDIDADGRPEIVIASRSTSMSGNGRILVIRKPDTGGPSTTVWNNRFGRACFTPALADVNGDGVAEIYCNCYLDSPGGSGVICVDGPSGGVIWATDIGGTPYTTTGHEVLLADYDGGGDIEVISQQNRTSTYEIVVLDALSGAVKFTITTSGRAYASMDCEDINYDGRNELIASVTGGSTGDVQLCCWNDEGTLLWSVDGGPPAVADIDLDGEAEVVCGWVENAGSGDYPYHLYSYSGDGILESEINIEHDDTSVSTYYPHYECPVIADFDPMTPEPEIAYAVNHIPTSSECIITVIRADGSIFWETPHFDHGEIISMSAADLSCDGIWDLCAYNMAGDFIVFDGATGTFWAMFDEFTGSPSPDPNRFIAIADMDYDCHAEFAVSTYQGGGSSYEKGVYIYGDDDDWNPVRRVWNTGSYYYTNTDDRLRLNTPEVSDSHWVVDNIWRAQRVIPCGLEAIPGPELIESPIDCAACDSIGEFLFSARIWNPTCEEIAYYSHVILEFDSIGDTCLTYLTGTAPDGADFAQCTTFIGDLMPETDTVLYWRFEVSPLCDSVDISFWLHATCLNSLIVSNRHLFVPVWTPRCHYPPAVQLVRPDVCGEVISCGPSDALGPNTGQEIIYSIGADSIFGDSYPLDFETLTFMVESNTYAQEVLDLTDPRLEWDGDEYDGGLFYNPNPLYPHGDTVVFWISAIYNELGCFTESETCTIIVDDMYPDTIDVNPDHGALIYYPELSNIYAVMADDFMDIVATSIKIENTSITANGVQVSGYTIDAHFDGVDPDTLFFNDIPPTIYPGDSVEVCIWGTYDSVDDTMFCGPNRTPRTCWRFIVMADAPIVTLIQPTPNIYSACEDQMIVFEVNSFDVPVDSMSIELEIDSVVHYITEPELYWDESTDRLYWAPPVGWWQHGNQANVCLNRLQNRIGQDYENAVLCFDFWLDFEPPEITFLSPPMGVEEMIRDITPTIRIRLEDYLANVDPNAVSLWLEGDSFGIPPATLTEINPGKWVLELVPESVPMEFTPAETITVEVRACDLPDTCAPNCIVAIDSFIVEPDIACLVFPNPFTPTGDNINEFAVFNYPHMYTTPAELILFDVRNREVFRKTIGPINNISESELRDWNGKDSKGELLPGGLYIYVIKQDNEVICNGTVILAR